MHGTVPLHRPPRILLSRALRLPRVAYLPSPLPEDDEPIPDRSAPSMKRGRAERAEFFFEGPQKRPNARLPRVARLEMAAIENALEAAGVEFTNGGQPGGGDCARRPRTGPSRSISSMRRTTKRSVALRRAQLVRRRATAPTCRPPAAPTVSPWPPTSRP
jgi:hypothetical protein